MVRTVLGHARSERQLAMLVLSRGVLFVLTKNTSRYWLRVYGRLPRHNITIVKKAIRNSCL